MSYIYRRIGFYLVAFWAAITINFFLPRMVPGDPFAYFALKYQTQIQENPQYLNTLKIELGVSNDPLPVQYVHYLWNTAHLDFGVSFSQFPTPVIDIIKATVPWTLFLGGLSVLVTFTIGTLLGALVAWRRGGWADRLLPPLTMVTGAFPSYFLALLLVYALAFTWGWFPLAHSYENSQAGFNLTFVGDVLYHAILPVLTLVLVGLGGPLLGMRNVMINTLAEEYIKMAKAKGLSDRRVMLAYAARNALLPNVTGFAISLGYVVGGVFLVEVVFSYPGVGYTMVTAAGAQDYPLVQALLLITSSAVLLANLMADLLYVRLDPRVRVQGK